MNLPFRRLWIAGACVVFVAGCGRKAPPMPPLHLAPARISDVSARRIGAKVDLRFTVPAENSDASTPVAIDRVDVYAMSVAAGDPNPALADLLLPTHLIGHVAVRDDALPVPAPKAGTPPPPPDPRPAPGDVATFVEELKPPPATAAASADPASPPRRVYVVVGVTPKRRPGASSEMLAVPMGPLPNAPGSPSLTHDETTLTLAWSAQPDAVYRVYATDRAGVERADGLLTPAPLAANRFTAPVEFGVERCFVVRAAVVTGHVAVESGAPPACRTPTDTFPPPAPAGLVASASVGDVTLTWEPVRAADLAGYTILRGEGTGDAVTVTPIATAVRGTIYHDLTAKAGVHYVYYVVAVDRANPANSSARSNRAEEIGR